MTCRRCLWALAALFFALAMPAAEPSRKLDLHVVPTAVQSYRLLAMDRDKDGVIWAGSIHHAIHRYDPRTGEVKTVNLPAKATASACICVGQKVYVLGQSYSKLIVYNRDAGTFTEKTYPSEKPDVWYGTAQAGGRTLYLFDRGGAGVIKWDTASDTGKALPWPYKAPFPASGQFEPADDALWCRVWDFAGGKYVPLGLARLDTGKDEFTGYYPFPAIDAELKPFADPKVTTFLPHTLKGKLVPFDRNERRWCRPIEVPGYGTRFGFIGGPTAHAGRLYFSLSTYNGTYTGCDGKPYHFLNEILEFDPATQRFEFLKLEVKDAYHQIAYMLSAGGEFFATGSNIREPGGKLNRDRAGEVLFRQTVQPRPKVPSLRFPFGAEEARTFQSDYATAMGLPKEFTNSVGMKLVLIPPGHFEMGPNGSKYRVSLSKPYYVQATEVTLGQYRKFREKHRIEGADNEFNDDDRPAAMMSWDDAKAFCAWLSSQDDERKAGRVYSLPTEAQWEWAARAGTATARYFGETDKEQAKYSWFNVTYTPNPRNESNGRGRQPVGKLPANAWGLHDMLGNVWEWCGDRHADEATGESRDPVMRGGSWRSGAFHCTAVAHDPGSPGTKADNIGFRIVCTAAAGK